MVAVIACMKAHLYGGQIPYNVLSKKERKGSHLIVFFLLVLVTHYVGSLTPLTCSNHGFAHFAHPLTPGDTIIQLSKIKS